MLEEASKPNAERYRWEFSWCPTCRAKTTFMFVADTMIRCNECGYEKEKLQDFTTGVIR